MSRRGDRLLGAVAAGLALLVLAACSGIPTGGPVRQAERDDDRDGSTVRYAPAPPPPGASPTQVVRGWLDAMLAYPPSTGVAEQYLTEEAADRWNPASGTHVYRAARVQADLGPGRAEEVSTDTARVRLTSQGLLDLDPRGRVVDAGASREQVVTLQRVDGEWRIAAPPDGLSVSEKFYTDYYRAFDVYFFDRGGRRLVPSVVHLPAGDRLATSLVASLARGPADPTAQQRSYLPGVGDLRPAVPVDAEGVAEVDLGAQAARASGADRARIVAQLVWTLRQVRDVTGVRVRAGSTPIAPDGAAVQPVDGWERFGPRPVESGPYAVVVDGDERTVADLAGGTAEPVPDAWDVDPAATSQVQVGRNRIATVSPDRTQVLLRTRTGSSRLEVAVSGLLATTWTPGDVLLVADRPGTTLRVRAVERRSTRDVGLDPALARLDVTSFATSPDGARYAVTTGGDDGRVLVGAVRRDADDRVVGLGAPRRLPWDVGRPGSVAWVDGTRVALMGDTDLGRQVFEGLVDGTGLGGGTAGGAPVLPDVAAADLVVEGDQRWAVDRRDRLWYLGPGSTWTRLEVGRVTSLSPGV
jgi:hypothetical protein